MDTVLDGRFTYIGMGGGIRGTKTFGMLSVLVVLCKLFPRSRWAIVRTDLPTLRRNVVPSMNKLRMMGLQDQVSVLNQSTWTYTFTNGSEIILFPESFSQDPELERWKGLEVNGFLLEEGSEIQESSAYKAIERAGSWIIPATPEDPKPQQPPPFVFATFNPTPNWPRRWFWDPYKAGTLKPPFAFIPATAADNPFIPDAVKESWKNLPEEEYKRFIQGEWDFIDDPDQLIKAEWVWAAREVEPIQGRPPRLGVDVARFGDDDSKIARMDGNALLRLTTHRHISTDRLADFVAIEANDPAQPVEDHNIRVDVVGLGAGTVDTLKRNGFNVTEVKSGDKPVPRKDSFFTFKNLRSQMWWELREKFRTRQISLPEDIPEGLITDLTNIRYTISSDKVIKVEAKDEIKKRIGRSTDDGDALVYADFDFPPPPRKPRFPGTFVNRFYNG